MSLKDTLRPRDNRIVDETGEALIDWQVFFRNLEKRKVLGSTPKLNTATATNAQIASKLNEIIQLLRDNKYIDDDTSSDP